MRGKIGCMVQKKRRYKMGIKWSDRSKKRNAEGKCVRCSNLLNIYKNLCDECAKKNRENSRIRGGYKPKKEGCRGRPLKKAVSSRPRGWEKRMLTEGRCISCGELVNLYKRRCDKHGRILREWIRNKRSGKAKQAGKPGRPLKQKI